jgi:hypothetical protein
MSRIVKVFVMAAFVAGLTGTASAQDTMTIQGSGSSAFETPPVATGGVAHGTCTLSRTSLQIACTTRVHNLVDLTAGHIHIGGPGVAGPVAINIPELPLRISNDFTLSWTWRESDLIARPLQGVNTMSDLIEACSSGNCYLNFHTSANPGGEIRINLCPTSDSRAANPFFAINVCAPNKP